MHEVTGSEHAGQRSPHGGLVEDPLDLGYPGQDVVAWIAFLLQHGLDLAVQVPVKLPGQPGIDLHMSVGDKPADGIVLQQMGVSGWHGGSLYIHPGSRYRVAIDISQ